MTRLEFPDYAETATRVQLGRRSRFRFVQTPQWALLMKDLSDPGYRVYSLLLAHANQEAGDGVVWPSQEALAEALGKSEKTISRIITKELKPLGLVDIETYRYGQNNTRRGNVYTVHEEPPEGWQGLASVVEFHAARKATQEVNESIDAGQTGDPNFGVSGAPKNEASGDPKSAAVTRRKKNYTKKDTAPSGRVSAPDARRASTGSSARATRGGFAASGKTSSSKQGKDSGWRRVSKAEAEAIRVVEAGFPEALRALLPSYRPPVLRDVILESLRDRTAGQLAQRAARRWLTHGYAEAMFGGKGIGSPVGVAVALVRAPVDCPDMSCEDGLITGSGEPCRACRVRKADRRGPKPSVRSVERDVVAAPIPGQLASLAAKWWCITGCGFNSYGVQPVDQLCRECRADLGGEGAEVGVEDASIRQVLEAVLLGGEAIR